MHSFRCRSQSPLRSHTPTLLYVPNRRRSCLFLAAPVEPHEQGALCCGPSPKGTICPTELGLATPAFAATWRQKGTCRVDVAQQASRINHHLFPSAHIPPLQLPSSLLLPQLTTIPMTACHRSPLSQGKGGKKTRKGGANW